jgi:hypothetical protein
MVRSSSDIVIESSAEFWRRIKRSDAPLYLTASYEEDNGPGSRHDVLLWHRIIQRVEIRDIRVVGEKIPAGKSKRGRTFG